GWVGPGPGRDPGTHNEDARQSEIRAGSQSDRDPVGSGLGDSELQALSNRQESEDEKRECSFAEWEAVRELRLDHPRDRADSECDREHRRDLPERAPAVIAPAERLARSLDPAEVEAREKRQRAGEH